jgi:hypothetical protein
VANWHNQWIRQIKIDFILAQPDLYCARKIFCKKPELGTPFIGQMRFGKKTGIISLANNSIIWVETTHCAVRTRQAGATNGQQRTPCEPSFRRLCRRGRRSAPSLPSDYLPKV